MGAGYNAVQVWVQALPAPYISFGTVLNAGYISCPTTEQLYLQVQREFARVYQANEIQAGICFKHELLLIN